MNRARSILVAASLLAPSVAGAQNIDNAIAAYKANDFPEAAARFYEVLKFDTDDESAQTEAQYGIAQSFQKMGLYFPAIKYYEEIIQAGNSHTYYFKAFEGLLDAGESLNDDLKVPQVLDKAYGRPLAKLEKRLLHRIHYALGELSYRQGKPKEARDFLLTIDKKHEDYPRAQYILGLMRLGLGGKGKVKADRVAALKNLQNTLNTIPSGTSNPRLKHLRILATFASARVLYEEAAQMDEENPKRKETLARAQQYYDEIQRLGPDWPQSLFERAWTHFLANEYGQSLGVMHTLQSPSFEHRYQPELHVLKSIVYYFNCHYDRVYKSLKVFDDEYQPMLATLKKINGEDRDSELWYDLVKQSTSSSYTSSGKDKEGLIPARVGSAIAADPKWQKLDGMVAELDRELKKVKGSGALADGPLGEELTTIIEDARKQFVKITGNYGKQASKKQEEDLQGFLNRAILVKLETQKAEQDWLEAGRKLQENVTRRRLPRPFIPDDTYIYWSWRNEYWADEVGFYRYAIKSECIE